MAGFLLGSHGVRGKSFSQSGGDGGRAVDVGVLLQLVDEIVAGEGFFRRRGIGAFDGREGGAGDFVNGVASFDIIDEGFGEPIHYHALESAQIDVNSLLKEISLASASTSHVQNNYRILDNVILGMVDEHIVTTKTQHQLRHITFEYNNHLYQLCD